MIVDFFPVIFFNIFYVWVHCVLNKCQFRLVDVTAATYLCPPPLFFVLSLPLFPGVDISVHLFLFFRWNKFIVNLLSPPPRLKKKKKENNKTAKGEDDVEEGSL